MLTPRNDVREAVLMEFIVILKYRGLILMLCIFLGGRKSLKTDAVHVA